MSWKRSQRSGLQPQTNQQPPLGLGRQAGPQGRQTGGQQLGQQLGSYRAGQRVGAQPGASQQSGLQGAQSLQDVQERQGLQETQSPQGGLASAQESATEERSSQQPRDPETGQFLPKEER